MGSSTVAVTPLTPTIGAEVTGVDLAAGLDDDAVDAVRQALLDHLVLFFRDQPMGVDQHLALAKQFGEIDHPPFLSHGAEHPDITVLDQSNPRGEGADSWHADYTHRAEPPMGSILRIVQLPEEGGGDTLFASMYAAYETLSSTMQRFLDGLTAVNTLQMMAERARRVSGVTLTESTADGYPSNVHPVVRVHPETGRKLLNVNANWTSEIVELGEAESRAVLDMLFAHIKTPDLQVRFKWTPASVAFWDNRAVQHFAVADYRTRRVMQRVTIQGDRPFGPTASVA